MQACRQAALAAGLSLGTNAYAFASSYSVDGCYSYSSGDYAGTAFFGTGAPAGSHPGAVGSDTQYRPQLHDCVRDYYLITTGTCPSGHVITDAAQCEAAATAFSMSDTTVTSSSSTWSGRPEGCVLQSEYGSDTLYLQTAASTYDSCTSSKKCLCMPPFGETAPPSAAPTPSPTSPT